MSSQLIIISVLTIFLILTCDGGTCCLVFPCSTADTLLTQLLQSYVLLNVCTRLNHTNLHSGRVCMSIVRKSTADSMLISDSARITFSFTSELDLCNGFFITLWLGTMVVEGGSCVSHSLLYLSRIKQV